MIIRVRTNIGIWRVVDLDVSATVADILAGISLTRPHVVYEKPLSSDPRCDCPLDPAMTLSSLGLRHGSMVHCRVDPSTCAENMVEESVATVEGAMDMDDSQDLKGVRDGGGRGSGRAITKRVIDKNGQVHWELKTHALLSTV